MIRLLVAFWVGPIVAMTSWSQEEALARAYERWAMVEPYSFAAARLLGLVSLCYALSVLRGRHDRPHDGEAAASAAGDR